MPAFFPPIPQYPNNYDTNYTLISVHNTTESFLTVDNPPYSTQLQIQPVAANKPEIWENNGYGNISGELFYYDSVLLDTNGKVYILNNCARHLGNEPSIFNPSGTSVRSFVVASDHTTLVDTITLIEQFLGVNLSTDVNSFDYQVRQLLNTPQITDDYNCPTVILIIQIISSNQASGTLVSYNITLENSNGNFSFTLDWGNGITNSSNLSGTMLFSYNTPIDPIITFTSNNCTVVQSPNNRTSTSSISSNTPNQTVIINVPSIPPFPSFTIPGFSIPSIQFNLPPIITTCFSIPDFNISIPSFVVNVPSFTVNISIPNVISLVGISIPNVISITPVSFPVISFGPSPLPTIISFGTVSFPSFVVVSTTPISVVSNVISIANPVVSIAPISLPNISIVGISVISFANVPSGIPSQITWATPPTINPVTWATPPTINPVTWNAPPALLVSWNPAPSPSVYWGTVPSIPIDILVNCGCCGGSSSTTSWCCSYARPTNLYFNLDPSNCLAECYNLGFYTTLTDNGSGNYKGGSVSFTPNCTLSITDFGCSTPSLGLNGFILKFFISNTLSNTVENYNLSAPAGIFTCGSNALDFNLNFPFNPISGPCSGFSNLKAIVKGMAAFALNENLNFANIIDKPIKISQTEIQDIIVISKITPKSRKITETDDNLFKVNYPESTTIQPQEIKEPEPTVYPLKEINVQPFLVDRREVIPIQKVTYDTPEKQVIVENTPPISDIVKLQFDSMGLNTEGKPCFMLIPCEK